MRHAVNVHMLDMSLDIVLSIDAVPLFEVQRNRRLGEINTPAARIHIPSVGGHRVVKVPNAPGIDTRECGDVPSERGTVIVSSVS